MVTLRDLTWPHLVDISPSKVSLSSADSRSSSVPDPVLSTATSPPRLQRFEIEKFSTMSEGLTRPEADAVYGPYAQLPTPPDGSGEDIGLDINPHLPPEPSSIDCSVCGPDQDRYDDLPPLPDSPLAIAQFGFISRESFNTGVRGLIQEEPDAPIGGYPAAPMESTAAIGTKALRKRLLNLDGARISYGLLPRLEVTSPGCDSCRGSNMRRTVSASSFSDPFANATRREKPVRRGTDPIEPGADDSVYTTAIMTALATPSRGENTDMSHDGARGSFPENNEPHQRLPDCCASPTNTDFTDNGSYGGNGIVIGGNKPYAPQMPFGQTRSGNVPTGGVGIAFGGVDRTDFAIGGAPNARVPGLANSDINAIELSTIGIPGTAPVVNGVPIDASGDLPAPATPKRASKRSKVANKGKLGIRKCRRVVLRRPVLALLVGRQLAGPTKEALKLISNGVPIQPDVQGLTEAAGVPGPAPVPPPPPGPAPI